jgi:predicted phosphodiesterase
MRIFAVSDLHVDYPDNKRWIDQLSTNEYRDSVLLLAGDISDSLDRLRSTIEALALRFRHVLYVPGNHELWVHRDAPQLSSIGKFDQVMAVARDAGALIGPLDIAGWRLVPLLGWYDDSFGAPNELLRQSWMDFAVCRWPAGWDSRDVARHFLSQNNLLPGSASQRVISFSHFMPRADLLPWYLPPRARALLPVLGTSVLDTQLRSVGSRLHVYGHSHLNRKVTHERVTYVNNAFGYPSEAHIAAKRLLRIDDLFPDA